MNTTTFPQRIDGEIHRTRSGSIGDSLYVSGIPGRVWSAAFARTARRRPRRMT